MRIQLSGVRIVAPKGLQLLLGLVQLAFPRGELDAQRKCLAPFR
jgi:hypothetical protein